MIRIPDTLLSSTMPPRLLVLTAGFGEGHNAAARALAAEWGRQHGTENVRVADVFALASPRINGMLMDGYLRLINAAPRLWGTIYAWTDRSQMVRTMIGRLHRELATLISVIDEFQPMAICTTYPVYPMLLRRAHARYRNIPLFTIVTDSISINSLWWQAPCRAWFVPNEDSAEILRAHGLHASRVVNTGFPVSPYFSTHGALFAPPALNSGARPRVLFLVNSGNRSAVATARRLFAEDWDVTCAVGRDEGLRLAIANAARDRKLPTTVLGWTDQIPQLLLTHHVVVSKAGGATTQEAIAARCPMIVNQVIPGQEMGNAELLQRHGIGSRAEAPETVVAELKRAFADRGLVWYSWRDAVGALSIPDAAERAVDAIMQLSGPRITSVASYPIRHAG